MVTKVKIIKKVNQSQLSRTKQAENIKETKPSMVKNNKDSRVSARSDEATKGQIQTGKQQKSAARSEKKQPGKRPVLKPHLKPQMKPAKSKISAKIQRKQIKKKAAPALSVKAKSPSKKAESSAVKSVKTKNVAAKIKLARDLPRKIKPGLKIEVSKVPLKTRFKPASVKEPSKKKPGTKKSKSFPKPVRTNLTLKNPTGLKRKQPKLNSPVKSQKKLGKKPAQPKAQIRKNVATTPLRVSSKSSVKSPFQPIRPNLESSQKLIIELVKTDQTEDKPFRLQQNNLTQNQPETAFTAENQAGLTRRQPDRWSDCGQVFFTGGEAFGISTNLRTIYIGRESEVKNFLSGGVVDASLGAIQKDTLLNIRKYRKIAEKLPEEESADRGTKTKLGTGNLKAKNPFRSAKLAVKSSLKSRSRS